MLKNIFLPLLISFSAIVQPAAQPDQSSSTVLGFFTVRRVVAAATTVISLSWLAYCYLPKDSSEHLPEHLKVCSSQLLNKMKADGWEIKRTYPQYPSMNDLEIVSKAPGKPFYTFKIIATDAPIRRIIDERTGWVGASKHILIVLNEGCIAGGQGREPFAFSECYERTKVPTLGLINPYTIPGSEIDHVFMKAIAYLKNNQKRLCSDA